ncbi:MAG: Asp/Glu/hydantoin racemase [Gemmatimonadetes bacterium]|nr:aspartate/glutamate racemase family protein [Gemmatimonadota bacterium]NNM05211.1 Asp/Glu/hydantoin racemase [Gemmatimonadota bacterium]
MRILIVNPNSDLEMTAAIQESAVAFVGDRFEVVTLATPDAPRFLETYEDDVKSGPGMLEILREHESAFDAFVIACHSDTNLHAARELTTKPVIGIGEASMKLASFLGHNFAIVTTHQHSIPGKVVQIRAYHLQDLLVSIRAPEEGEEGWEDADLFMELSRRAVQEDGAEVIVLGCAGMAGMDRRIQDALGVPVLDGVVCALILASGFAHYGVGTSKVLGYNPDY